MKISNSPIIHPVLFSIFFILFLYSYNVDELIPKDLFIPLLLCISFSGIIMIISLKFSKNSNKISLYLTILIILFFSYGHVYMALGSIETDENNIIKHRYLIPIFGIVYAVCVLAIKFKIKTGNPILITNGIAATLVLLTLSNIGMSYADDIDSELLKLHNENIIFKTELKPDIYYIILDEYGGKDSLLNYFNFDNHEFLEFLESEDFYVVENSFSNYPFTNLSTGSSMNMKYVNYLEETLYDSSSAKPMLEMFQENHVMSVFQENDYETIYIYGGVRDRIRIADHNVCEKFFTSDFVNLILKTSGLTIIQKNLVSHDWREIRLCALDEISDARENHNGPIFVFAHLRLPHDPFSFGPNGEKVSNESFELTLESDGTKEAYINQLQFTNKKIKEVIHEIKSQSKQPPIIILQSDHGVRFGLDWEKLENSDEDLIRGYDNINAFYFPDKRYEKLYDNLTPVNTFRVVFNEFFNTELEILPDKIYISPSEKQYQFKEITDIVNQIKID